MIWKKNSEINELIKGKRNITIARDILLSHFFQTPPKFWIIKQIDYDYQQALEKKQKNPNIPLKTQPISSKISNKSMIIKIFESF